MQNHLSNEARALSVEELVADSENKNLYLSKKLAPDKYHAYLKGLAEALFYGNDSTFTQYLLAHNCLTADALSRSDAAKTLAYNEFKRYRIRGVCLHAIKQNMLLKVCRIRVSKNQSEDANKYIGDTMHPERMLAVAQIRPDTKTENEAGLEHRILRPNSSLCVEIYDTVGTVKTLNKGGENNG